MSAPLPFVLPPSFGSAAVRATAADEHMAIITRNVHSLLDSVLKDLVPPMPGVLEGEGGHLAFACRTR